VFRAGDSSLIPKERGEKPKRYQEGKKNCCRSHLGEMSALQEELDAYLSVALPRVQSQTAAVIEILHRRGAPSPGGPTTANYSVASATATPTDGATARAADRFGVRIQSLDVTRYAGAVTDAHLERICKSLVGLDPVAAGPDHGLLNLHLEAVRFPVDLDAVNADSHVTYALRQGFREAVFSVNDPTRLNTTRVEQALNDVVECMQDAAANDVDPTDLGREARGRGSVPEAVLAAASLEIVSVPVAGPSAGTGPSDGAICSLLHCLSGQPRLRWVSLTNDCAVHAWREPRALLGNPRLHETPDDSPCDISAPTSGGGALPSLDILDALTRLVRRTPSLENVCHPYGQAAAAARDVIASHPNGALEAAAARSYLDLLDRLEFALQINRLHNATWARALWGIFGGSSGAFPGGALVLQPATTAYRARGEATGSCVAPQSAAGTSLRAAEMHCNINSAQAACCGSDALRLVRALRRQARILDDVTTPALVLLTLHPRTLPSCRSLTRLSMCDFGPCFGPECARLLATALRSCAASPSAVAAARAGDQPENATTTCGCGIVDLELRGNNIDGAAAVELLLAVVDPHNVLLHVVVAATQEHAAERGLALDPNMWTLLPPHLMARPEAYHAALAYQQAAHAAKCLELQDVVAANVDSALAAAGARDGAAVTGAKSDPSTGNGTLSLPPFAFDARPFQGCNRTLAALDLRENVVDDSHACAVLGVVRDMHYFRSALSALRLEGNCVDARTLMLIGRALTLAAQPAPLQRVVRLLEERTPAAPMLRPFWPPLTVLFGPAAENRNDDTSNEPWEDATGTPVLEVALPRIGIDDVGVRMLAHAIRGYTFALQTELSNRDASEQPSRPRSRLAASFRGGTRRATVEPDAMAQRNRARDEFMATNGVAFVNLSGNRITDDGARLLAEVVAVTPTIRHLDLTENLISDTGASVLVRAIQDAANVEYVGLERQRGVSGPISPELLAHTACVATLHAAAEEVRSIAHAVWRGDESLTEIRLDNPNVTPRLTSAQVALLLRTLHFGGPSSATGTAQRRPADGAVLRGAGGVVMRKWLGGLRALILSNQSPAICDIGTILPEVMGCVRAQHISKLDLSNCGLTDAVCTQVLIECLTAPGSKGRPVYGAAGTTMYQRRQTQHGDNNTACSNGLLSNNSISAMDTFRSGVTPRFAFAKDATSAATQLLDAVGNGAAPLSTATLLQMQRAAETMSRRGSQSSRSRSGSPTTTRASDGFLSGTKLHMVTHPDRLDSAVVDVPPAEFRRTRVTTTEASDPKRMFARDFDVSFSRRALDVTSEPGIGPDDDERHQLVSTFLPSLTWLSLRGNYLSQSAAQSLLDVVRKRNQVLLHLDIFDNDPSAAPAEHRANVNAFNGFSHSARRGSLGLGGVASETATMVDSISPTRRPSVATSVGGSTAVTAVPGNRLRTVAVQDVTAEEIMFTCALNRYDRSFKMSVVAALANVPGEREISTNRIARVTTNPHATSHAFQATASEFAPAIATTSRIFDNDGVRLLCQALQDNTVVQAIDLSCHHEAIDDTACKYIAELLTHNHTLTKVDLSHTAITDAGIKLVLDALDGRFPLAALTIAQSDVDCPEASPSPAAKRGASDNVKLPAIGRASLRDLMASASWRHTAGRAGQHAGVTAQSHRLNEEAAMRESTPAAPIDGGAKPIAYQSIMLVHRSAGANAAAPSALRPLSREAQVRFLHPEEPAQSPPSSQARPLQQRHNSALRLFVVEGNRNVRDRDQLRALHARLAQNANNGALASGGARRNPRLPAVHQSAPADNELVDGHFASDALDGRDDGGHFGRDTFARFAVNRMDVKQLEAGQQLALMRLPPDDEVEQLMLELSALDDADAAEVHAQLELLARAGMRMSAGSAADMPQPSSANSAAEPSQTQTQQQNDEAPPAEEVADDGALGTMVPSSAAASSPVAVTPTELTEADTALLLRLRQEEVEAALEQAREIRGHTLTQRTNAIYARRTVMPLSAELTFRHGAPARPTIAPWATVPADDDATARRPTFGAGFAPGLGEQFSFFASGPVSRRESAATASFAIGHGPMNSAGPVHGLLPPIADRPFDTSRTSAATAATIPKIVSAPMSALSTTPVLSSAAITAANAALSISAATTPGLSIAAGPLVPLTGAIVLPSRMVPVGAPSPTPYTDAAISLPLSPPQPAGHGASFMGWAKRGSAMGIPGAVSRSASVGRLAGGGAHGSAQPPPVRISSPVSAGAVVANAGYNVGAGGSALPPPDAICVEQDRLVDDAILADAMLHYRRPPAATSLTAVTRRHGGSAVLQRSLRGVDGAQSPSEVIASNAFLNVFEKVKARARQAVTNARQRRLFQETTSSRSTTGTM
jgi:hypothetical protein